MVVKVLTPSDVQSRIAESLELTTFDDLLGPEGLSKLLRRAAGFLCPCSASALARTVVDALAAFVADDASHERLRDQIDDTIEAMTAYGDLIELPVDMVQNGRRGTLLAAAPPRFVARQSGAAYIMGVAPDNVSFLPPELEAGVEHRGHVRRLVSAKEENISIELRRAGLAEWSEKEWLYAPPKSGANQLVSDLEARLRTAGAAGEIEDLEIIEPTMPPDFYIKRWRKAERQTGRFVARRPRAYGSPLWCFVDLQSGSPIHLLDFPTPGARSRGCDEAFYVQAAIDAMRNCPQFCTTTADNDGATIIRFFMPLPEWARRRLDIFGTPLDRSGGGLFSYILPAQEVAQELEFLRSRLWMTIR